MVSAQENCNSLERFVPPDRCYDAVLKTKKSQNDRISLAYNGPLKILAWRQQRNASVGKGYKQ